MKALLKVAGKNPPEPGRPLGQEGQKLWNSVISEFTVGNPAAQQILLIAAESVDRLMGLREERKACTDERALGRLDKDLTAVSALVASLLVKLDRYVERRPRRGPGRPPQNLWWDGTHDHEEDRA
jgi:hypothetical protein